MSCVSIGQPHTAAVPDRGSCRRRPRLPMACLPCRSAVCRARECSHSEAGSIANTVSLTQIVRICCAGYNRDRAASICMYCFKLPVGIRDNSTLFYQLLTASHRIINADHLALTCTGPLKNNAALLTWNSMDGLRTKVLSQKRSMLRLAVYECIRCMQAFTSWAQFSKVLNRPVERMAKTWILSYRLGLAQHC